MADDEDINPDEGMDPIAGLSTREVNEMARRQLFLELVGGGTPHLHAAVQVGWSPAQMRAALSSRDFAVLVMDAEEMRDEVIERRLYRLARKGNLEAIKMWLYNRRGQRWSDTKKIEARVTGHIGVAAMEGAREAVLASLRQALSSGQGLAALQPGGIIDVEEVTDDGGPAEDA